MGHEVCNTVPLLTGHLPLSSRRKHRPAEISIKVKREPLKPEPWDVGDIWPKCFPTEMPERNLRASRGSERFAIGCKTTFWRLAAQKGTHPASRLPGPGKRAVLAGMQGGRADAAVALTMSAPASSAQVAAHKAYRCSRICFLFFYPGSATYHR